VLLLLSTACGESDESTPCRNDPACPSDAGSRHLDPVAPGHTPPPDPGAPQARGTEPTVLAVRRLFLGDTDWNGERDWNAWKSYGHNLDGILSSKDGDNHCAIQVGAHDSIKADGEGGIDNSFGGHVLPILAAFGAPTQETNAAIDAGDFTLLLKLSNLDARDTQSGVHASVFEGASLGATPTWDGSDAWPIAWESVVNGDAGAPLLRAESSYLAGGTWVSAPPLGRLPVRIRGATHDVHLEILGATIAIELEGYGPTATGTRGVIAGFVVVAPCGGSRMRGHPTRVRARRAALCRANAGGIKCQRDGRGAWLRSWRGTRRDRRRAS
jgi:hypothetical protein